MKKLNVCVVGATGLVGRTFLKVLEEYHFPIQNLKLLASSRSAGKILPFAGKDYVVEELQEDSFTGYDLALFSAGGSVSEKFAPVAVAAGLTVVDNSSFWRQKENIPLVVPEVNLADAFKNKLIANPNCSTIQSVLPLKALQEAFGLKKVSYTTYQAVSGSGEKGKADLQRTKNGEAPTFYPYDISQTCIPEIDIFLPDGYTKEEVKMMAETQKILHQEDLPISATCVRVPVANSHGVSIQVELGRAFSLEEVREVLKNYPGIVLQDDPAQHLYPVSTTANGTDSVYVGRLRKDKIFENGLLLYTVADNIRKGAAANAVQIALALAEASAL